LRVAEQTEIVRRIEHREAGHSKPPLSGSGKLKMAIEGQKKAAPTHYTSKLSH
jgi:hypothetical protein